MALIHVRHRVEDYAKWKAAYDQTAAYKRGHGWKRYQLYSVGGDRNDVLVMEEFETLDQARGFVDSPYLHEAMGRAGIVGAPEILIIDELAVGSA